MIRHRPLCYRDIPECARIVATHPALGPRYGDTIRELPGVWRRLLDDEWSFTSAVFEETDGAGIRINGVGISVFVTDEFFREAKTPPFFWLGPELTRRIAEGRSPVLTERQLREANSRDGLNVVIWQSGVHPAEVKRAETWEVGVSAFLENHRGFRLNELIVQAETPEHFVGMINAGAMLYGDSDGTYQDSRQLDPQRAVTEPHLTGLTRETASRQVGSWIGTLFNYRPPRLGFSRSEQRLLWAAIHGRTDEELSDALCISQSAVKKTWRAIYARVTDRMPGLIPNQLSEEALTQDRGKEKKRRLLTYLREHPEELRPISRKLLQASSADPSMLLNRESSRSQAAKRARQTQ
jgi:hypothetical protein